MVNNKHMKLYSPGCMENNKQMELYSMGEWNITNKLRCILLGVWKITDKWSCFPLKRIQLPLFVIFHTPRGTQHDFCVNFHVKRGIQLHL
jgi:hypothetical protein